MIARNEKPCYVTTPVLDGMQDAGWAKPYFEPGRCFHYVRAKRQGNFRWFQGACGASFAEAVYFTDATPTRAHACQKCKRALLKETP